MNSSHILAQIIGLFCIFNALGMLININKVKIILAELKKSDFNKYLVSMGTIAVGIIMVTLHNNWVKDLTFAITILGWVILSLGILNLIFMNYLYDEIDKLGEKTIVVIIAIIFFLIGSSLLYYNFALL